MTSLDYYVGKQVHEQAGTTFCRQPWQEVASPATIASTPATTSSSWAASSMVDEANAETPRSNKGGGAQRVDNLQSVMFFNCWTCS